MYTYIYIYMYIYMLYYVMGSEPVLIKLSTDATTTNSQLAPTGGPMTRPMTRHSPITKSVTR